MMKRSLLILFAFLTPQIPSLSLAGGDSVGNGGVIWACRSGPGGQNFHAGILTDLFEAKIQYGLTLISDPGGEPFAAYKARKTWLESALPEMYSTLKPRFEYVEQHLTFINAELLPTNDYNNAVKPIASTCPQGAWSALNIANFREEDQQILISSELWNSSHLPTLDKAALLFHEAIYYWMRTYFGSTNSDKARRITGILFSTLPAEKMKEEIRKVLGTYPDRPEGNFICVMKNSKRNQVYVAYDNNIREASLKVRMRCQDEPDSNWCERSSLECERIDSGKQQLCIAENFHIGKIYTGKGRSLLEAKFNAHMSCYIGSLAQGASAHHCPDFEFMECE